MPFQNEAKVAVWLLQLPMMMLLLLQMLNLLFCSGPDCLVHFSVLTFHFTCAKLLSKQKWILCHQSQIFSAASEYTVTTKMDFILYQFIVQDYVLFNQAWNSPTHSCTSISSMSISHQSQIAKSKYFIGRYKVGNFYDVPCFEVLA